jgi:hypothetical protein
MKFHGISVILRLKIHVKINCIKKAIIVAIEAPKKLYFGTSNKIKIKLKIAVNIEIYPNFLVFSS